MNCETVTSEDFGPGGHGQWTFQRSSRGRSTAERGLSLGTFLVCLPGGGMSGCHRRKNRRTQVLIGEFVSPSATVGKGEGFAEAIGDGTGGRGPRG